MKLALVGAGPDVIDLLPTPFGLVRSGVAPDHQHVKNVMVKFNDFLKLPNVGYYGGVQLGTLRLKDLRKAYNGVVLGYGSGLSNTLNLHASNLKGIFSANSIVGWYNGHPEYFKEISDSQLNFNCESVIIIGNGNVALDIARILIKDPNSRNGPEDLANTDITARALELLKSSKIKNIHIVGRRGALEAAFTTKEFRDLTKIEGLGIFVNREYLKDTISQNSSRLNKERGKQRLLDLMVKNSKEESLEFSKNLYFHFQRSPFQLLSDKENRVVGIKFEKNIIKDGRAIGTREFETINGEMVITAIGSRGERVDPDIPWDSQRCIVPNDKGRVIGTQGLYVSGWLKTGPVGTIATTLMSSLETAHSIIEDKDFLENNHPSTTIEELLKATGIKPISYKGWHKIDLKEIESGQKANKIREKMVTMDEMYSVANSIS